MGIRIHRCSNLKILYAEDGYYVLEDGSIFKWFAYQYCTLPRTKEGLCPLHDLNKVLIPRMETCNLMAPVHILELPREIWFKIFESLPCRFFKSGPVCKLIHQHRNAYILLPTTDKEIYDWGFLNQFNFQLYGFHRGYSYTFVRFMERMHMCYLFTRFYRCPLPISSTHEALQTISLELKDRIRDESFKARVSSYVQQQLSSPICPNAVIEAIQLRWYVEIACLLTIGDPEKLVNDSVSARDFLLLPLFWPVKDVPLINVKRFQKGFEFLLHYDNVLLIGLLDLLLTRLGTANINSLQQSGVLIDIDRAINLCQWNLVEFAVKHFDYPLQMNTARVYSEVIGSTTIGRRIVKIFRHYPHVLYRFMPSTLTGATEVERANWAQLWTACYGCD